MGLYFLCLEIFLARICDVTIGTLRTIMMVRGRNLVATILAFFEVTIWFVMVKDALTSEYNSILIVLSYALGYATGTYLGGYISSFIKRKLGIQIIIDEEEKNLIDELRQQGFAVTVTNVKGYNDEKKYMLHLEIDSNRFKELEKIVHKDDKKIFMTVSETKYVRNGYFGGIAK